MRRYFDKVLPKTYGTTEPPYFMCTKRFWGTYCFASSSSSDSAARNHVRVGPEDIVLDASTGTQRLRSVHISKLRKVFRVNSEGECGSRDKVAIDDLDLDMCVLVASELAS
jgi:hypothetical protein